MTISPFLRALAAGAFLLFAAPMSNAAVNPPASPGLSVATAQALVKAGKFNEALTVLRPLLQAHPDRTDILFLTGLAAIEASRRPGTPESDQKALLDEAIGSLRAILIDRPGLVRVRLEPGAGVLSQGRGQPGARPLRARAGRQTAGTGGANVQRFLAEIRARRRWTMYLGAAVSPDSNCLTSAPLGQIEVIA